MLEIIWKKGKYHFMLAPLVAFIIVFRLYPVVKSLWISFTRWTVVGQAQFIGFANYKHLFIEDSLFWLSLWHNIFYVLMILLVAVPVSIVIAARLNMITHRSIRAVASGLYYFPYIVPAVVVGVIWLDLYHPTLGLINTMLKRLYLSPQPWLSSASQAMTAISITGIWSLLGFNTVIYLAGLQGIPKQFYEAAEVDGASRWRCFLHITLPLLLPITFFIIMMNTIWSFQLFTLIYVMTSAKGGPGNATYTLAFYLWKKGFLYSQMGYASTIGIILLFFIFTISMLQFRLGRRAWQ